MTRQTLRGVVPVIATPLNDDETLDAPALGRIIELAIAGGVNGIWVLGSGGELPNLTQKERRRVIETTVETVNGRVPVVAGIGHTGTLSAITAAQEATSIGADMLNLVPPYYYGYSEDQKVRHYQLVLDAIEIPLVIYNRGIPPLSLKAMEKICKNPKVAAIKDVPTEFRVFQQMVASLGSMGVGVMTAAGRLIHPSVAVGGNGTTAVEAAVAPELCMAIYKAALESRNKEAAELQQKLYRLSSVIQAPGYEAIARNKAAFNLLGLCSLTVTAPFEPASPAMMDEIKAAMKDLDLI